MKRVSLLILSLTMALSLFGCSAQETITDPTTAPTLEATAEATPEATPEATLEPEPVELTIAAAASLTDVTAEIAESYKAIAPNVALTFTYASSGSLQTQIEQGAPVDIFMSAAQKQMNALEEQSFLLDGSRSDLLENKVVLIVPNDSELGITGFEDLALDTVGTVAMGDPASVPAGQYAEEVLTSLGIIDAVEAKANFGTDVRQVLTWTESGEVDCGIVYATDAATSDSITIICSAPEDSIKQIIYPVAILASSTQSAEAQAFIDFMVSDECAAIFKTYGFAMAP